MENIRRIGRWLWDGWGNILWLVGLIGSFAVPAWATKMTGLFDKFAPLSWVVAGFIGLVIGAIVIAVFAWAHGKIIRNHYDAKLLALGGEIDPLAKTFERKRIFLNEFVLPSKPLIENKTFIECEIIGPASIILRQGNNVANHRLPICDAYVMNSNANPNTGYLFDNCVFRGCSFVRVNLMFSLTEYNIAKDVDWLNWVSIRPDHVDEDEPTPLLTQEAEGAPVKRWKWPWQN